MSKPPVGRQNVIVGEEPKNQQHGSALSGGEFTKARHVTFVTWILEERVKPDGVFGRHSLREALHAWKQTESCCCNSQKANDFGCMTQENSSNSEGTMGKG
jgi:hypothetical protein